MHDDLLILHEDAFFSFFMPYLPEGTVGGAFGGLGLLPDKDWPVIRTLPETCIWTVQEEVGEWWISPGIHMVNRHCYLVSQKHHDFMPVLFRSHQRRPVLTSMGLKRQITIVSRRYQLKQTVAYFDM